MKLILNAFLALTLLSNEALACIYPPPPPPEPGESAEAHRDRTAGYLEEYFQNWRRETEQEAYTEAGTIFLGRIDHAENFTFGGTPHARRIVVRPIATVRGDLPENPMTLQDRSLTSCGLSGDGFALEGGEGAMAFVFLTAPSQDWTEPTISFSVLARDATANELIIFFSDWKAEVLSFSPENRN